MIVLPIDISLLRAAFPDWLVIDADGGWQAIRRANGYAAASSCRSAAIGRDVHAADTPVNLAIQLATLEFPLGITPTS